MTWPEMPLGRAVEVTMGRQRSPKHATGDHVIPYLRAANVQDGRLDLSDVKAMNFSPVEQRKYAVQVGDVLVTEGSGSAHAVGASACWTEQTAETWGFQNTLLRLRSKGGISDPGYVYVLARWLYWTGQWADVATGTNILHIGAKRAESVPVPVPPVDVQRRIVDLIGRVDKALDAAQNFATRASAAVAAVRCDLLARAGGTRGTLGDLAVWRSGSTPTRSNPAFYARRGHPWVNIGDLSQAIITETATGLSDEGLATVAGGLAPAGSTLISMYGTIGAVSRLGVPAATNQAVLRGVPHPDVMPEFLTLAAEDIGATLARLGRGATQMNVNKGMVESMPAVRPALEEQAHIVRTATAVADTATAAQHVVSRLMVIRAAVLADLLSGHTDIPDSYDRFLTGVVA
jgi:restriction endonuclease S subunit